MEQWAAESGRDGLTMSARALLNMLERGLRREGHDVEAMLNPPDPTDELMERRLAIIALGGEVA